MNDVRPHEMKQRRRRNKKNHRNEPHQDVINQETKKQKKKIILKSFLYTGRLLNSFNDKNINLKIPSSFPSL